MFKTTTNRERSFSAVSGSKKCKSKICTDKSCIENNIAYSHNNLAHLKVKQFNKIKILLQLKLFYAYLNPTKAKISFYIHTYIPCFSIILRVWVSRRKSALANAPTTISVLHGLSRKVIIILFLFFCIDIYCITIVPCLALIYEYALSKKLLF